MYVCLCHGIAERHVREAAETGNGSVAAVCKALGVRPQCAKCVPAIRELLRETSAVATARLEESAATA
jgi:bacterioferritin-associated ferredoxin